ncbi:MAG: FAD:protein FMN transferase [Desulfobacterales bacterium]|nr:FAD:protein FMN transferase [Desulfobacterales bacterium]
MGTTYHIKVVYGFLQSTGQLEDQISRRLREVNQSMSAFIPESELNRFNNFQKTGEPFHASSDFMKVMTLACEIHRITEGAWDGTLKPLIDLWGFGSKHAGHQVPEPSAIAQFLKTIGFQHIACFPEGYLVKKKAFVTVDLASIAKGYGVDAICELIAEDGFDNYLVEIGGEVRASGRNSQGRPWKVGINTPKSDAAVDDVYRIVALNNQAMATSGNYRNFFEMNGKRYSHVVDPRTGYPVDNAVISVSVSASSCAFADALATGLMVMGPDKGIELINGLENIECLMVVQNRDGSQTDFSSSGFDRMCQTGAP